MNRLLLSGALGKMGKTVTELAPGMGFSVVAGVDAVAGAAAYPIYPGFSRDIAEQADVMIDFSRPSLLPSLIDYAVTKRMPCVLASTGYGEKENQLIREASAQIPLFVSANLSVGVYALKKLIRLAHDLLPQADIEIIEKHHRYKDDAPSGTAMALLEALSDAETPLSFGRKGSDTRRKPGEIGIHAVRGGTLPGEHQVDFLMDNEVITVTHSAQSRAIFAQGALRAAEFILTKSSGLFDMDDLMSA